MKNLDALKSDDPKMNMTPMIDMTFLLVVFFMLTIDLTQKEFVAVELPFARSGPAPSGPSKPTTPRISNRFTHCSPRTPSSSRSHPPTRVPAQISRSNTERKGEVSTAWPSEDETIEERRCQ